MAGGETPPLQGNATSVRLPVPPSRRMPCISSAPRAAYHHGGGVYIITAQPWIPPLVRRGGVSPPAILCDRIQYTDAAWHNDITISNVSYSSDIFLYLSAHNFFVGRLFREGRGLAVARSPVGENDYQSFSKTHRPFHYPTVRLVKSEELRVKKLFSALRKRATNFAVGKIRSEE